MTADDAGPSIIIDVVDEKGAALFHGPLTHGFAPRRMVREQGIKPLALRGTWLEGDGVVIGFEGVRMRVAHHRLGAVTRSDVDADLVRQRLAAYSVVGSARGVLLAQLSVATGRPGLWILPGGRVEVGEQPQDAVRREIWEETGQRVTLGPLVEVSSAHRVGPGRDEVVEDFHAVRLVFTAWCDEPNEPVVHDVGGSTSAAAWFPLDDLVDPAGPGYPPGGMAPWALEAVCSYAGLDPA